VLITSPDPFKLQALVAQESARQAILVVRPMEMVAPGVWAVAVYQLKPMVPRWRTPALVAGGTLAVGAVLWLLVQALVGILAGLGLATVLGVLVVALVVARLGRSSGCETTVTVRHRH
jgi:hypothetical protein